MTATADSGSSDDTATAAAARALVVRALGADPFDREAWFCAVYRVPRGDDAMFHSGTHDVLPLTGPAAR